MEYTGQCMGGPDDGNLISAKVQQVHFWQINRRYLDGLMSTPLKEEIAGFYQWDSKKGCFNWRPI